MFFIWLKRGGFLAFDGAYYPAADFRNPLAIMEPTRPAADELAARFDGFVIPAAALECATNPPTAERYRRELLLATAGS